ncbi:hypothetical protein V1515DRAFT_631256 [Lipomyces mesembrius]
MDTKIAFILGAGHNIGHHVAKKFAANGYKGGGVQADFKDPLAVVSAFKQVRDAWGEPSVVIYNAYAVHIVPADDAFSLASTAMQKDLAVNVSSLYVAIQETVKGWKNLFSCHKVFIFTGNTLNVSGAMPSFLTLGVGKAAGAHLIDAAVKSYGSQNYKFYYADERNPDGSPTGNSVDGKAHSESYFQLAEEAEQQPWNYTFVKFDGYTKFELRR